MEYGYQFFNLFKKELDEYFLNDQELTTYKGMTSWTKRITKETIRFSEPTTIIDKVLKAIFDKDKGKLCNEYYHIDNMVFKDMKFDDASKFNKHCWKPLAVVEHENDSKDWSDELVKLAYINAPLKIVISYGDYRNNYEEEIEFANKIANVINLDMYTINQEYLLIFGPTIDSINYPINSFSSLFKCFKYNRENKCFEIANY